MKKLSLLGMCLVLAPLAIHGQKMALQRAIKLYQTNNLTKAEKEITVAIQPPFSSIDEWAKTLNYYFHIKADLYGARDVLPSHLHELASMMTMYAKCKEIDKELKYTPSMTTKAEAMAQVLIDMSDVEYKEKHYDSYLTIMDFYVMMLEKMEKHDGLHYAYIAKVNAQAGHENRAIYYWQKMIDIDYEADHAYKEMLTFLYGAHKYDEVDKLLGKAKEAHPESTLFMEIEILRLMDRELYFRAKTLAEETLQKDPNNLDVVFLLGLINHEFQDPEGAVDLFLKVAHHDDDHFETHLELGKYFWSTKEEEGHLNLAKHYLEKAENLNPSDSSMLRLLRRTYFELNDLTNYHRVTVKIDGAITSTD